jgi:anti-sigma regulatory factor (Ser/Thr protein kinase)
MPVGLDLPTEAGSHPPMRGALLRLSPQVSAPHLARRSVRGILDWAPEEATDRIELLVSELMTNSVLHAGLGRDQTVDVRLTCEADRVRLEVTDPGQRFRADGPRPEPGPEGRWGFYLVDALADRWGVDDLDEGKAVWFEIDL